MPPQYPSFYTQQNSYYTWKPIYNGSSYSSIENYFPLEKEPKKTIEITEKDKELIINKLKEKRAFCADSGYSSSDYEETVKLAQMVSLGLVKTIKSIYWIEK